MIRLTTPADHVAIHAVIAAAFEREDEARLVAQLRDDNNVLVELVAERDGRLIGHVLYSTLRITRTDAALGAAALAPVSVLPEQQRSGVGADLIRAGNARCAMLGVPAIIVLGHPSYYPRFGFSAKLAESLEAPFRGPAFMALELEPGVLSVGGRVHYAKAFGV